MEMQAHYNSLLFFKSGQIYNLLDEIFQLFNVGSLLCFYFLIKTLYKANKLCVSQMYT